MSNEAILSKRKEFMSEIRATSQSYSESDIFRDACRMFAITLHSPLILDTGKKKAIEDEFRTLAEKYGKNGYEHICKSFTILIEALELHRGDFLGRILEAYNATNKSFAQYFTPDPISRLMAKVSIGKPVHGKIVTLNDPACGAGSLLIEAAEEFIEQGGRQGDIFVSAQDLDYNAFNITFVQLSLLGYPAEVTRMNSLSQEVFEGPWQTAGFFLHNMPLRKFSLRNNDNGTEKPTSINVQMLKQSVFDFSSAK